MLPRAVPEDKAILWNDMQYHMETGRHQNYTQSKNDKVFHGGSGQEGSKLYEKLRESLKEFS